MKRHHLAPRNKGQNKDDMLDILRDVGGIYWLDPIYHRMQIWNIKWFSELRWQEKKIVEGRFFGGTLQLVPLDELPIYYQALTPKIMLDKTDKLLLKYIKENGPLLKNKIIKGLNLSRRVVNESIHRLDLSFNIVRAGWVQTGSLGYNLWDTFEKWCPCGVDLESTKPDDAKEALVLKFLRSNVFLNMFQLTSLFKYSFEPRHLQLFLRKLEKGGLIISGNFLKGMTVKQYGMKDEIALLAFQSKEFDGNFIQVLNQGDPFVRVWKWRLRKLFKIMKPSDKGPAWLSYIFINENPAGLVDYKWKIHSSQINDIWILPVYLYDDSLNSIIAELEKEASFMRHKRIEINHINGLPAPTCLETSLGKTLLSNDYSLKDDKFIKDVNMN